MGTPTGPSSAEQQLNRKWSEKLTRLWDHMRDGDGVSVFGRLPYPRRRVGRRSPLNDRLTVESQNVLGLAYLRDSANTHNASQAKLGLIKWCANTKPVYWLRLHLPSRVRQSCINHDRSRIRTALQDLVNFTAADAVEIRNAVSQAALPSDGMGGLSLTCTLASCVAHALGAWGSALPRIKSLFPRLRDVSLESPLPAMVELKECLASLHSAHHAHARDRYLAWSADHYNFSTTGAKTARFHPPGLPKRRAARDPRVDPACTRTRAARDPRVDPARDPRVDPAWTRSRRAQRQDKEIVTNADRAARGWAADEVAHFGTLLGRLQFGTLRTTSVWGLVTHNQTGIPPTRRHAEPSTNMNRPCHFLYSTKRGLGGRGTSANSV